MQLAEFIQRGQGETLEAFLKRLGEAKPGLHMTWEQIAEICNTECSLNYSESWWRKYYKEIVEEETEQAVDDINDAILELKKEKAKLSDERVQNNAYIRRMAREETLKEIAHDFAQTMNRDKLLDLSNCEAVEQFDADKEAILQISDWHYGIEIDNYWNEYNPDIAVRRVSMLTSQVIEKCKRENIKVLHVANLADLIAGRIHLQLRLESRFDVITQIMQVSEILAEMLYEFVKSGLTVHYYDVLDNHSRLEPNKRDSLDLESLARLTSWYLKERVPFVNFHDNKYAADIMSFEVLGHKYAGVHGHEDRPTTIVDNLTMMLENKFDVVITSHLHHFSGDEKNRTYVLSNGSLMGTDAFAEKLRLSARPSQNLIIVTKDDPMYEIRVIKV